MNKVIIGADPEVVVVLKNDKYEGMFPARFVLERAAAYGCSSVNHKVKDLPAIRTYGGVVFPDGASWELNPRPSWSPRYLVDNIKNLFHVSLDILDRLSVGGRKLDLWTKPSIKFDTEMLELWGDPSIAVFGCDPDKSIHPREVDPSCIDASQHQYRYFGGHIHLGWPVHDPHKFYSDPKNLFGVTLLFDALCGMLGIVYDKDVEKEASLRRKVYGQPGVYRIQPHGVEYRTVSNSWLASPEKALHMFSLAKHIPALFRQGLARLAEENTKDIVRTLITGNVDDAIGILYMFNEYLDSGLLDAALGVEMNSGHWKEEWLSEGGI